MTSETHRRTVELIMRDRRPRIATDVQYALKARGLKMDYSEISQALQELVRLGELDKDGRGTWDHPTIYQMKEKKK